MAKLTKEMKAMFEQQLSVIATASKDGNHLVMAVLAYLFVVVVLLGAKKNFWCDVGASVDEDPSVVAEVGRLLSLLRQKV